MVGNPGPAVTAALRWQIRIEGTLLVLLILFFEFRRAFGHGMLVIPDLFLNTPAVPSYGGLPVWFSKWTPSHLGTEAGVSASTAILGLLTGVGLVGAALQAFLVVTLGMVAALGMWRLADQHVQNPELAWLAPVLYLTSPVLFILLFDGDVDYVFWAFLPFVVLFATELCRTPGWRKAAHLGVAIALSSAFVPFTAVFVLPVLLAVWIGTSLVVRRLRSNLRSAGMLLASLGLMVLLNAPYYLGNLGFFTSQGVASTAPENLPIVQQTYAWSDPVSIFSLIGASYLPRYESFFPTWVRAVLLVLPAIGMVALVRLRGAKGADLRLSLGLLAALAISWILATANGMTLGLLEAVPYLLVFNLPTPFYIYLALAFPLLATLGTDDLVSEVLRQSASRPDEEAEGGGGTPPLPALRTASVWSGRASAVLAVAIVLTASFGPSGFYLISGDFKVLEAPAAMGFPPQWNATEPASFRAIYDYLQAHGGDAAQRVLILPAPTFMGGETLPGYVANLFNENESTGSNYTGPFFLVPASAAYATEVLNYLIANRTDRIGVPLGLASVRYVIVDRELNFTGPPRWVLGSLVGAPDTFLDLLDGQRDLTRIYDGPLFTVYENEDFRPYVQAYGGLAVVRQGSPGVVVNRTVFTWAYGRSNWSMPQPPDRIAGLWNRSFRSLVNASWQEGNMTVEYVSAGPGAGINASSTRLDNDGFYVFSQPVPVEDQQYVFRYRTSYRGPADHEGGYLLVAGLNASFRQIWGVPPGGATAAGNDSNATTYGEWSFDPAIIDPATRYITAVDVFPFRFGNGTNASFRIWDLALNLVNRPTPDGRLAPLLLTEMPDTYAPRGYAVSRWLDLSSTDLSSLETSNVATVDLCVDLCPYDGQRGWDQLLLAYNALPLPPTVAPSERDPTSLSGAPVSVVGPAMAEVGLSGAPFRTLYVHAMGNGSLTPSLAGNPASTATVAGNGWDWYAWTWPASRTDPSLQLTITGSVRVDVLLLTRLVPGAPPPGATVQYDQSAPWSYHGSVPNATSVLLLAQSFNPSWSLDVGGRVVNPVAGAGWANLFVLPPAQGGDSSRSFTLVFTAQLGHVLLIAVQVATAVFLAIYLLRPYTPKARRLLGRIWQKVRAHA